MGRRAKPAKRKTEAKRSRPRKSPDVDGAKVRDLEKRLAEALKREAAALEEVETCRHQLRETQEQQTATADVLKVISRSTFDLQPVLKTLIGSATQLCGADKGFIFRRDGDVFRGVADHGTTPEHRDYIHHTPVGVGRDTVVGRVALERRPIHVPDILQDPEYRWAEAQRIARFRTALGVPMLREGLPIGAFFIWREEVNPFTDKQIELVTTFADQAVIAIENVRLFTELDARNRALTEALDQQTATSEILRVISSSPTDVRPVFAAILRSAVTLCGSLYGIVVRAVGDHAELVAVLHPQPEEVTAIYPAPLTSSLVPCRAIRDNAVVNVAELEADGAVPAAALRVTRQVGIRSLLAVPMRRDDVPIGAILIGRPAPGAFTDEQVALLQTFADQAVIAIENVRLFNELEARNAELTATLDRQVATGEVLRAISQAQTDAQPVFEIIAASARRLCGAAYGQVQLCDGERIHLAAVDSVNPEGDAAISAVYPLRVGDGSAGGRAIEARTVAQIPDLLDDRAYRFSGVWEASGLRSLLAVPMLREGVPIGTIGVGRAEPGAFPQAQVDLLRTFADQAVIAIENVRLFTELQTSNRELTTALETQTATSDILRVISRSQTDVQPVFDAILASALRLLRAYAGALTRVEGDHVVLVALTSIDDAGDAALRAAFPQSLRSGGAHAQAIRNRAPLNIADAHSDPRVPEAQHVVARVRGYRSLVAVPLLRHEEAIGSLTVVRREPGGFTDDEIALLQTFADQAVIAIENARLLNELQARTAALTRSVDELTALGEVSRALSSTLDLETVLQTIVTRALQIARTAGCTIWEYDASHAEFRLRASHYAERTDAARLQAPGRVTAIPRGQGVTSRVMERREPVQIADIAIEASDESPIRRPLVEAGHRALLGVPLLSEDEVIGVLAVTRKTPGAFEPDVVRLLSTFATQSALAIRNARLFLEIEDKSRQLEAASQHKSEFLANMSHELRTPLNAIIGFSEVLTERMFGELNDKQDEYLQDIYASGQHLLSLINDILDLSKIEAGRMELEPTDFDLPGAIDNALTLVRERAGRRGITLGREVAEGVGTIRGDERKVKQVLLNLLSNAIKFTPEGGRIDVRATIDDGLVEVAVADTGVGIAPEDQEAVFEEFRQVGTADKKVEGTGLGLALSRKFVELHGGRIRVESQVGQGSTFTFTLPPVSAPA